MFSQIKQNFYSFKNNLAIAYDKPYSYFHSALISTAKNMVVATSTILAKGVIYFGKFVYDTICDIGDIAANFISSPIVKQKDGANNSVIKEEEAKEVEILNKSDNQNNSFLTKGKNFVTSTWHEANDSYIGGIGKTLKEANYPLAKLVSNVTNLVHNIAKTTVSETTKVLTEANKEGLKSAYLAGAKMQAAIAEQANLSVVAKDKDWGTLSYNQDAHRFLFNTQNSDGFNEIDQSEGVELQLIGAGSIVNNMPVMAA